MIVLGIVVRVLLWVPVGGRGAPVGTGSPGPSPDWAGQFAADPVVLAFGAGCQGQSSVVMGSLAIGCFHSQTFSRLCVKVRLNLFRRKNVNLCREKYCKGNTGNRRGDKKL